VNALRAALALLAACSKSVAVALLAAACSQPVEIDRSGPTASWPEYGATKGGLRWSPLTQVTPANVTRLELAWEHHSGDVLDGTRSLGKTSFQTTPIIADGRLVYCTPFNRVFALDPETGRELWRYDPAVDATSFYITNCRGVSAWTDERAPRDAACRTRILLATLDARLIALAAQSGRPCPEFGRDGVVDLREGIGDTERGEYGVTSPPAIVGDRIVTGSMVLDNRRRDSPGGVVRAYDARTGALRWGWEPIPPGAARGPDGKWLRGTTNAWSVISADPELGLVYVPTGNTSPDYFGGLRDGGDFYSSSVVALDVRTGAPRWHFQTVHHDIWDYDVGSPATLFEWAGSGGPVPALAQPTKLGHLFLLDRRDGRALFPIEERAVPQDGVVPDDFVSPTQPFPTAPPPLHPARLTPDEAFGFTFWDRGRCREKIAGARSDGIFTPPSLEGTIQYPGMVGGMNWGGVAVDPQRQLLVVNVQRIASYVRLVPRAEFEAQFGDDPPAYGFEPQAGTPYALERVPLLSPFGAPCNPPPWGELVGIDVRSGQILWRSVLGTTRDLAPWPLWLDTGSPNLGGPMLTASGLVFIGATTDHFLRAFDASSGAELWRARLPTSAHATPMTYRLSPEGKQYVVIAAGGHGLLGTPPGDALLAFALPD
jgi:quinoprotein glucose dehydrogenase